MEWLCDRGAHWSCVRSGSGITILPELYSRKKHVTVARTMLNTRHGRSNTPNVMRTILGHLVGWRQMQLRHCGVVRWTDISSDIRLSCPTETQIKNLQTSVRSERVWRCHCDCQRKVHQSHRQAVGESCSKVVHSKQEGTHSWGSRLRKADSSRHCKT